MNHYKLLSKLDNGIVLTPEDEKYIEELREVLDLYDREYGEGTDFTWMADFVFIFIVLTVFALGIGFGLWIG